MMPVTKMCRPLEGPATCGGDVACNDGGRIKKVALT
jgi:hypothetical protein